MSTAPTDYTLPDILYQPWEDVEALQDRLPRAALARLVLGRQPVDGSEAVTLGLAALAVPPEALDEAVGRGV